MLIARSRLHRLAILIFLLPLASALWQRDPLSAPRELLKSASAGNLIAFAGGADPGGGADSAAIDFYDASQPGLMLPRLNLTMPRPYTRHYAVGASTAGSSLYFHIGTGSSSGATNLSVQYVFANESDAAPQVVQYTFPALPRYDVAAGSASGIIVWAGGFTPGGSHERDMFIWNLSTNPTGSVVVEPYPVCNLTQDAAEVVGAGFGTWIVFSGGRAAGSVRTQVIIIDTLNLAAPCLQSAMVAQRYEHAMGLTANWIVVMGGTSAAGGAPLNSWEAFDLSGNLGPTGNFSEGKKLAAGACNDRGCVLIGGETEGMVKSSKVEFIDLSVISLTGNASYVMSVSQFPSPAAPTGVNMNAAACGASGTIIVAGGSNDTAAQLGVYVYGAFYTRPLPPRLSVSRAALAAASYADIALFAGGQRPIGAGLSPVGTIDMFFYSNGSMQAAPFSLQPPRSHLCACVANGVIVFAGGNNGTSINPSASDVIEYYHVAANTWGIATARLVTPRSNLGCVTVGNQILFGSGVGANPQSIVNLIDVFNVSTTPPYVTLYHTMAGTQTANYGAAVRTWNGQDTACFYQGQQRNPTGPTLQFYITNGTAPQTFAYTAATAQARSNLAAVAVRDDTDGWLTLAAGGLASTIATSSGQEPTFSFIQMQGKGQGQGMEVGVSSLSYNASDLSAAGLTNRRRVIFAGGKQSGTPQAEQFINYYDVGLRITVRAPGSWAGAAVGDDNTGIFVVAGGFLAAGVVTNTVGVYYTELVSNSFVTPPPPVLCVTTPPATSAVCTNGVWVITGTSIVVPIINITTGEIVVIEGQVQLPPGAVTVIYSGNSSAPIIVSGTVQINGGPIYITLNGPLTSGLVIPIINGTGTINGSFTTVVVTGGDTECTHVTGQIQQTEGIGVILSVEDTCKKKGFSTAAIAGIAVGGAVGLALILVLILLLLKRSRAGKGIFQAKNDELTVTV